MVQRVFHSINLTCLLKKLQLQTNIIFQKKNKHQSTPISALKFLEHKERMDQNQWGTGLIIREAPCLRCLQTGVIGHQLKMSCGTSRAGRDPDAPVWIQVLQVDSQVDALCSRPAFNLSEIQILSKWRWAEPEAFQQTRTKRVLLLQLKVEEIENNWKQIKVLTGGKAKLLSQPGSCVTTATSSRQTDSGAQSPTEEKRAEIRCCPPDWTST